MLYVVVTMVFYNNVTDDEEIQDFMWNDGCAKLIDKVR